jgi:hypothetical protein
MIDRSARLGYALGVLLVVCCAARSSSAQVANGSIGLTSLATGQLVQPQPPTVTPVSGSATTWGYKVVGVDLAGGTTPASSQTTIANGPATLNGTHYNTIGTGFLAGANGCQIYRTQVGSGGSPTSTPLIATVACGTSFNDTGVTGPNATPPSANTTGSINIAGNLQTVTASATGTMTAQAFSASGSGAGTDILGAGLPLALCATIPVPPCITGTGQFFEQAPTSITGSTWGITWPQSGPSANGPLVLSTETTAGTYPQTSQLYIGTFTDPAVTTPAVVTTSTSSFMGGDIVTVSKSGSSVNYNDSGILLATAGTRILAATVGGSVAGATTTYGPVTGSAAYGTDISRQIALPVSCTIGNLYVTTSTAQPTGAPSALSVTVKNASTTTLLSVTFNSGDAAQTKSDPTHTFTYSAGALIDVVLQNTSGSASASINGWSMSCQ